ncbi:ABC transporter permease [Herpetosiphon llansteffanensis]|uniref:ABC transporter permease n=1 Tax=Herpetosiphon llansteffanensis TaxID=2094568 RepID=UPI0013DFA7D3|nr:ABC transporter permease [Herpetosiphon llansteffanensis]
MSYRIIVWVLALILLVPIAIFLVYAFAQGWFFPALWPERWDSALFLRQLADPQLRRAFGQSLIIATGVSMLALMFGYPAARVLELQTFRGRGLIYGLFFLPTVVPSVATGIGLNIVFLRLGLAGTLLGVMLVHLIPVLPYVVLTLGSSFARYDRNYEHQAAVLGASPWFVFWRVSVPMLLPSLVVAGVLAFLISWSQYVLSLLIGGGKIITLPMLLFSAASGGNQSLIASLSLIFITPLLLLLGLVARYLGSPATGATPRP